MYLGKDFLGIKDPGSLRKKKHLGFLGWRKGSWRQAKIDKCGQQRKVAIYQLYPFSIVAIINYHKFSKLNLLRYSSLGQKFGWTPLGSLFGVSQNGNQGVGWAGLLPRGSRQASAS